MVSIWEGRRVRLRGVEPSESDTLMELDQEISYQRDNDHLHPPRSRAGYRRWTEAGPVTPDDDQFGVGIEALDEHRLVGGLGTHAIDKTSGVFSYGISIGGAFRRRGYATESITLLLRYMFGERRFQKCDVEIYAFNTASLELHRRLGFIEEGRRRRSQFFGGTYHDAVLMGLTVEEFTAAHDLVPID